MKRYVALAVVAFSPMTFLACSAESSTEIGEYQSDAGIGGMGGSDGVDGNGGGPVQACAEKVPYSKAPGSLCWDDCECQSGSCGACINTTELTCLDLCNGGKCSATCSLALGAVCEGVRICQ